MSKILTVSNGVRTIKVPEATFKRWPSMIVDNKTVPRQGFKVVSDVKVSKETKDLVNEVVTPKKVPAAVAKAVKDSAAKK